LPVVQHVVLCIQTTAAFAGLLLPVALLKSLPLHASTALTHHKLRCVVDLHLLLLATAARTLH
jgi:hypothetical protein